MEDDAWNDDVRLDFDACMNQKRKPIELHQNDSNKIQNIVLFGP